jgi:hypothetical protein
MVVSFDLGGQHFDVPTGLLNRYFRVVKNQSGFDEFGSLGSVFKHLPQVLPLVTHTQSFRSGAL